jgi:hypothetical protein
MVRVRGRKIARRESRRRLKRGESWMGEKFDLNFLGMVREVVESVSLREWYKHEAQGLKSFFVFEWKKGVG